MAWDERMLAELRVAVDSFDRAQVESVCDRIIAGLMAGEALSPNIARKLLAELRRKCYFDFLERVADAMRSADVDDEQVRRQYAQGLIDQGRLSAAVYVLEPLAEGADPEECAEARGLLGRIEKQLYVNAVNADPASAAKPLIRRHLERALDAYWSVYSADPSRLWHGINVVALAERAKRDKLPVPAVIDARAIASSILASVSSRKLGDVPVWDYATAAEACLALGQRDDALVWIAHYVERPDADAFELSSTERQLREVWGLRTTDPFGSSLLPVLQSQILARRGGKVDLSVQNVGTTSANAREMTDSPTLQRTYSPQGFRTLTWFRRGTELSDCIGLVLSDLDEPVGTGFLARSIDLGGPDDGTLVFVTCAHVISPDADVRTETKALEPKSVKVRFDGLPDARRREHKIERVLWTSRPAELDVTIVRLDGAIPCDAVATTATDPPANDGKQRVYIIGHPGGGVLRISLYDNELLDYDARRLHYHASTEKGSSGSPVFDDTWRLIGVHHAGPLPGQMLNRLNGKPGQYEANEGIRIDRIAGVARW
jgi:hypothetical protein